MASSATTLMVRGQSWGRFHLVRSADDEAALCGRRPSTHWSHEMDNEHRSWALLNNKICGHCLNRDSPAVDTDNQTTEE